MNIASGVRSPTPELTHFWSLSAAELTQVRQCCRHVQNLSTTAWNCHTSGALSLQRHASTPSQAWLLTVGPSGLTITSLLATDEARQRLL